MRLFICRSIFFLSLLWGFGFGLFYLHVSSLPIPSPDLETEGVVIFTGGVGRLSEGLELLEKSKTQRILISGVGRDVRLKDLSALSSLPIDWGKVDIGRQAHDTEGNGKETAQWVSTHGYKTIRLVTSYYHIPRSLLEFRRLMPQTQVVLHPVFPEKLKELGEPLSSSSAKLENFLKSLFILGGEFNKLLVAGVRALWEII